MKTLRYSLAALIALGTLNFANAQTTPNEDAKAQQNEQKTDKSVPPSTKTSLLEALEGTTIGGYAYSQYTAMFGADADGMAARFRTSIDVVTGAYHGFSVGTRVWASMGASAPNGGTFLENSGISPKNIMNLGLYALYGRQVFESSATVITIGKMNIVTPFTDSGLDYGYGASLDNYDAKGVGFHLQAYGAWALDDDNSIPNSSNGINPNFTSEKALFVFGISGDRKELSGVGFQLWAAHALDTIDFLTFADLNYTVAGVTLQGQVAATQVNTSSKHFATRQELSAKLRGIYNVQLAYNGESGVALAAGYTGSFGDGYGALLNGSASFNMGGQIWYDTVGANGYDLGGVGGYKNPDGKASTIQVVYASLGYKGVKNLSLGVDYAYVSGNNNYRLMEKGARRQSNMSNMNVEMHEVSVSTTYNFSDKLSLSILAGSTFGDLQMGRARAKLNYSF